VTDLPLRVPSLVWLGLLLFAASFTGRAQAAECSAHSSGFLRELAKVSEACRHPLCGRIYSAKPTPQRSGSSCPGDPWPSFRADVEGALTSHGALLLGETHDNPSHHLLQAAAVTEFARHDGAATTAVVFEQMRANQQSALDGFAASENRQSATVTDLKRVLDWGKSGWPKDIYDPLFKAVIAARLPIYAGDVPRAKIMKAAKEGEGAVPAATRKRLGLNIPLGAKLDDASLSELEEAHCGAMPKSALGGLAFAQRYRDAKLADTVLKASSEHGSAILIAGGGHVRKDRGVPWYIHKRAPGKAIVSVIFVEVDEAKTDASAYMPRGPDGEAAADYLVFTPRAERGDPCEKLRKK
jgi:uncharacterized iron-regulated protein